MDAFNHSRVNVKTMDWDTDAQGVYGNDPVSLEVCGSVLYIVSWHLRANQIGPFWEVIEETPPHMGT